jgi:hypothetical protein
VLGRAAKVHGKRLRMVCVLEMSADHRLHYHCIVERPTTAPSSASRRSFVTNGRKLTSAITR